MWLKDEYNQSVLYFKLYSENKNTVNCLKFKDLSVFEFWIGMWIINY